MPLCKYMDQHQFDAVYDSMDKELLELCDEIQQLTGQKYAVESRAIATAQRRFFIFTKFEQRTIYQVLVMVSAAEAQCIHLLSGFWYPREEAGAFLAGVVAQAWEQKKAARATA